MHTDPLLYRLFQERPAPAFALAGISQPGAAPYRMQATEVKQTAFRLDGVLRPPPRTSPPRSSSPRPSFRGGKAFTPAGCRHLPLPVPSHETRPWRAVVVFPHLGVDTGLAYCAESYRSRNIT